MKFFRTLITAAVLCIGFAASAQGQLQVLPNDPAVRKGQLENGLTYYIRHNANPEGRAEFYLATNVGALQETPDQDGLAHFLEHMCFNGTKNFPEKGILDYLQGIGASFGGNVNASTGVEQTVYMLTNIPLHGRQTVVDSCILIMHDYSHFVDCDPAEIDKERGVILEEKRSRNTAAWRLREKANPFLYGDSKYATTSIIGSEENLKTFKPESLVNFYHTWYRPDMQALIVVGDVDVDYVEGKIAEIFADIPAAVDPKAKDVIMIPDNEEPLIGIITDPENTSSSIDVIWKSEAMPEEMNNTVQGKLVRTIESIIGMVMEERLNDICAQPDAPFLNASYYSGKLCETAEIINGSILPREGDSENALRAFLMEIKKMQLYGFTAAEVDRAKSNLLSAYENAAKKADTRKNPEFVQELINNFFDNEAYMEPNVEFELMKQILSMVNEQLINPTLAQLVTSNNMVVLYMGPEKEGLANPTEDAYRAIIEEVANAEIQRNDEGEIASELLNSASLKAPKKWSIANGIYGSSVMTLPNGLKVILYPSDLEKDNIRITLSLNGGESLIENEDLYSFEENIFGLYLQNGGVAEFASRDLGKMLAGKNVSVSPFVSSLSHGISASTAPKDLETALQLMYLYFTKPRFDADEYAQGINMLESVVPNYVKQPDYKLQKHVYDILYPGNPRKLIISEEVMSKANLATIEKVYRQLFHDVNGGAVAIIAGDFTITPELTSLVAKYFGTLPKGKKPAMWKDRGLDIAPGARIDDFKVEMQTPKVTVANTFSCPVEFTQDNRATMQAISYIMNMRYVTSLREEEGGTYGASVNGSVRRLPTGVATLQVVFETNGEQCDKLREIAMSDLRKLASEGPTAEEFDMTVKYLAKRIPESRVTNSWWMETLMDHHRFGTDTNVEYEAAVNNLTPDKIKNLLKAILDSGNCAEVVMRPQE